MAQLSVVTQRTLEKYGRASWSRSIDKVVKVANSNPVRVKTPQQLLDARRRVGRGHNMARQGNQNARTHGLASRAVSVLSDRSRAASRLMVRTRKQCPWLADSDASLLRRWAETSIICQRIAQVIARQPYSVSDDSTEEARSLTVEYRQMAQLERSLAERLGLDPVSRFGLAGALAETKLALARTEASGQANAPTEQSLTEALRILVECGALKLEDIDPMYKQTAAQ
jgi:phage terminase small subunit